MSPNGEHPDTRPFLCIPYWTDPIESADIWDTGAERPLPSEVVSYLCESIHTSPYVPGEPLEVTVDVRNSGGGNSASIATVAVYWADPSVGFAKPNFFAASAVAVPPARNTPALVSTPTMRASIPASAPSHVCLVVAVSHPQDRAGTVCDPIGDRHWAQRNLQAVQATVGAPAIAPIIVANPFEKKKSFALEIAPAAGSHAHLVAAEFQTEPSGVLPTLRLLDADGAQVGEAGEQVAVTIGLGGLEQLEYKALIELTEDLPAGQSAPLEARLVDVEGDGPTVGSLGIVVVAPR